MKSPLVIAFLLAGAIGVCAVTAGEQPRPSKPDDLKNPNQLREENMERLLAGLADGCQEMLEMQIAVYDGTRGLHQVIEGTTHKKPSAKDKQISLELWDKQKTIIVEITAVIDMLNAEEVAIAFPEVFVQLRADMKHVQGRLENSDMGMATQALEKDIIDTLQEMVEALTKSR